MTKRNMTDLEIIKKIEKVVVVELLEWDEDVDLRWLRGFSSNQKKQVTRLSFYDCGLSELDRLYPYFDNFVELYSLSLLDNSIRNKIGTGII